MTTGEKIAALRKRKGITQEQLSAIQKVTRQSVSRWEMDDCFQFIRECGYFFLATSHDDIPKLRPMGMIYSDGKALFIATDKRKNVYSELTGNPSVELASYNLNTWKWIRISGRMELECSGKIREEMLTLYPMITQEYVGQDEIFFVIFKLFINDIQID